MSDLALRVENLGKMYRIGEAQSQPTSPRQRTRDLALSPFAYLRRISRPPTENERLWALKDVSFEVKQGEAIGIIGRNGAGKSTLLKILAHITEPTQGRALLYGRVASLLEVGTGFHPELTGRENIYLNGAILGMTRHEIDRKFDEIVAFAEVEKFLDTPVKRYSSGMYVRLAFAVAAHLEPEILLVDEVLAVGDAAFQRKCLGKMSSVTTEGRTILFVSHNLVAVQTLCRRSLLLGGGRLVCEGTSSEAIQRYLEAGTKTGSAEFNDATLRNGSGGARYRRAQLLAEDGVPISGIPMGGSAILELTFEAQEAIQSPNFSVRLHTPLNQDLVAWRTQESVGQMPGAARGGTVRLRIRDLNLLPGVYHLALGLSDGYQLFDLIEDALALEVLPRQIYEVETVSTFRRGEVMFTPCSWDYDFC